MADMQFLPQLCLQLVGNFSLSSGRIGYSTHQFVSDDVLVSMHNIVVRHTKGRKRINVFIDGHSYKLKMPSDNRFMSIGRPYQFL